MFRSPRGVSVSVPIYVTLVAQDVPSVFQNFHAKKNVFFDTSVERATKLSGSLSAFKLHYCYGFT